MKRRVLRSFFLVLFFLFIVTHGSPNGSWAAEQKYPSRSIDVFCGFSPGGPTDLLTRTVARGLEKYLGVTVVPGNKPGAGAMVAATALANSRPDGYSMAVLAPEHFGLPILYGRATYSLEDIYVIGQVARFGSAIAVSTDSPWRNFQEFFDYVRKNSGVKYGHPGVGSTVYLRMENLNKYANMKMVGVPYKSDPEIIASVLGQHVPAGVSTITNFKPQADAGKMRILFNFESSAQSGLDPTIADLPTVFGESVHDFDIPLYLVVPAKTPTEIVQVLERTLEKVAKDPEFISDVKKLYLIPFYIDGQTIMRKMLPGRMQRIKEIMQYAGLLK